ncbi:MAG: hypothetical protein OES47_04155 [Acidobacteriota bacterium]|nr:hypothetical protein [Acidobacteriota bacterium]
MERDSEQEPVGERRINEFLGEPTQDLEGWRWLWHGDKPFPLESYRPGLRGRLTLAIKGFLQPLVRSPQANHWERQRVFNLVLITHLEELRRSFDDLGTDLQKVQGELLRDLREVQQEFIRDAASLVERIEPLEEFKREGMKDLMLHTDALFARVDQKLDRVRRQVAQLGEGLQNR